MKKIIATVVLATTALTLSPSGFAADVPPTVNISDTPAPASDMAKAVERASLSAALSKWGRETQNAHALIVSAEILSSVAAKDGQREKAQAAVASAAAKPASSDKAAPVMTVASLLDEARALAGPDEALQGQIARVSAQESKGRNGGPLKSYGELPTGYADTYNIRFTGKELAAVAVINNQVAMGFDIYDQNGNLVCTNKQYTSQMLCEFTPIFTGDFRVKVSNESNGPVAYALLTN